MGNPDLIRVTEDAQLQRTQLLALVERLSPDDLAQGRAGGWTVLRVLRHVIESEAIYVKLFAYQTGRTATEIAVDEPQSTADVAQMLAATRDGVERLLEGIDDDTLYRMTKVGHEEYSPLSLFENIASHDREHRGQIEELIRELRPRGPVSIRPDVSIRIATLDDLPRLTEIYNHYIVHTPITFDVAPFSVDERRAWFHKFHETGRHRLLVAEDDGVVAGFAGTSQFRTKAAYDTTVEATVYCAAEATGRGIGTALYAALFDAIGGEDIKMAVAGITMPNYASVALHERFGFVSAGLFHAVGRKFGQYWDVAWYERPM